jgi:cathepsin B
MANYTGGVYVPSGQVCGGHVMRIIGWGTEDHLPYWLVANSWGTAWGLQGFLKWIRGKDAQGIESGVVAGLFEN